MAAAIGAAPAVLIGGVGVFAIVALQPGGGDQMPLHRERHRGIGGVGVFVILALWMFLFPQLWRTRTYEELSAAQVLSGDRNKPS